VKLSKWPEFPSTIKQHLQDRLEDRGITLSDLIKLDAWVKTNPEVPDDYWYKDFGSFVLCGNGQHPSTFLEPNQKPYGKQL
jgi:hypothetical protein